MHNHTQTPWQYAIDASGTRALVVGTDDETVFHVSTLEHSTAHSNLEANMQLMVRAVNAHYGLLGVMGDVYATYGRLHDFVSDCIEGGRLTEDMLPDDYQALTEQLAACVPVDYRMELAIRAELDPFDLAYRVGKDEHATILAALRFYQQHNQGEPFERSDDIHALASSPDGTFDSLEETGIEALFQRLHGLTKQSDEPDEGANHEQH